MPATIAIELAQEKLKALIDGLESGEEIVITEDSRPVARLIGERNSHSPRPAAGLGKGSILYMAEDFDEPMEEFREYTE